VRTGEAEFGLSLPVGSDSDLVYSPLYDDPYGLVCRKDDPLGAKADVGWADLVERRLVTVHRASGNRTTLEAGLAAQGINLSWFYEVTRLTSALALVDAGLGPSVLPKLACAGPEAGNLVWRPLKDPVIFRSIGLLQRPGGQLSPACAGWSACFRRHGRRLKRKAPAVPSRHQQGRADIRHAAGQGAQGRKDAIHRDQHGGRRHRHIGQQR
jgi:DNA-binding transcriptional LysR family regulator